MQRVLTRATQQAALKTLVQTTVRPKVAAHLAMAQWIAARIGKS
jgi:hypothetical protein